MGEKRSVSFIKTAFSWSIAQLRCKFDKFGPPKGQMGEKRFVSFQSIFEPCRQEPCYFRKQDMTMAGSLHDPERSKTMKGPFGPDRPPTQNLNFRLRQLSGSLISLDVVYFMARAWLALADSAAWFLLL